jgi:hypothetical protein
MKSIKVLIAIAGTTLLILACNALARPITTKPQTTTVPASVTSLTSTAIFTETAAPLPAWATDFAQPILNAIEHQTPRFQDDFSDGNSNWAIGKQGENLGPATPLPTPNPGQRAVGETGYVEGEYFTTAEPNSCLGGTNSRIGEVQDFVAEFDARFASGVDGGWNFQFRINGDRLYAFGVAITPSYFGGQKCESGMCGKEFGTYSGSQIKGGSEWNHMVFIVRSAVIAVYANGMPIVYVEDKAFSEKFKTGTFSLSVCNNTGNVPVETRWDNLKIWDISDLP